MVSWFDHKTLISRISKYNDGKIKSFKINHDRKLERLGIPVNSKLDKTKVIVNLSDKVLTQEEEDSLAFGLDFALPITKPNFVAHFLSFEKLIQSIANLPIFNRDSDQLSWTNIIDNISSIASNSFKETKQLAWSIFGKDKIKTLINLKKDDSIIITKPDKGRGVVLLNKIDYLSKVNEILSDTNKFIKVPLDPFTCILKLEDKLNRLLRSLKDYISKDVYSLLFASGSVPGILYGLPKVHKQNCPIRPILSAIGTFNYNLAKFFVPILAPLTTNEYTIKNSSSFVSELNQLNCPAPMFMASFDIVSLFTNIPLTETIDICISELFKDQNRIFNLSMKHLKSLLELAVKESVFFFNECLFKQVDGVAMGSPLGPTLANAFLCFYEKLWLSDCPPAFKPLFYRRYVDDCFLLFKDQSHVGRFLEYLNLKHPNIKFTVETENNNAISFFGCFN